MFYLSRAMLSMKVMNCNLLAVHEQHSLRFNPLSASHNYCRLLCHLLVNLKVISANSVDPDQTAPLGAV